MANKYPNSHPFPPANFNQLVLPVSTITEKAYRLNPSHYKSAIFYDDSGSGRFDIQDEQGVLYLGETIEAAFIETFGRKLGENYVSREFVKTRNLFEIKSDRQLQVANLYGAGLVKLGADSELTSGRDYDLSRSWAKAIFDHPQQVDGIRYFSRHDNTELCLGLFDRGSYTLFQENLGNLIEFDELRFYQILDYYKFGSD
jgi:RES domain